MVDEGQTCGIYNFHSGAQNLILSNLQNHISSY